jgi:hypothetical protein
VLQAGATGINNNNNNNNIRYKEGDIMLTISFKITQTPSRLM